MLTGKGTALTALAFDCHPYSAQRKKLTCVQVDASTKKCVLFSAQNFQGDSQMSRFIMAHLDADCFYVSAERVRFTHLKDKPLAVLGNQGICVIAKSYEMKAQGVKTGMPIWEAKKICPEGIYLKRDFRWYGLLSQRMLHLLQELCPQVEYYSIDEFFFAATALPRLPGQSLLSAAQRLQEQMLQQVGVPVSIGISWTKTLAKLASDTAKPFGCRVLLDPDQIEAFLARQPVEEVSGIGEQSRRKLAQHGITTCLHYIQAGPRWLRRLLTIKGEQLWRELRGQLVYPLLAQRPPHQLISRGGSIGRASADPERVWAWVVRHLERLIEALDYHQALPERLALSLRLRGGDNVSGDIPLPEPTARFDLLLTAARELLTGLWQPPLVVTGVYLLVSRLHYGPLVQKSLFTPANPTAERIALVKRLVNARIGRFAVRSGATLPLYDVYQDEAQQFDICDIPGKMCF